MRKLSILAALVLVVAAIAILARGRFDRVPAGGPVADTSSRSEATVVVPEHGPVSAPAEADPEDDASRRLPDPVPADDTATEPVRRAPTSSASGPERSDPSRADASRSSGADAEAPAEDGPEAERVLARASDAYGRVRTLRASFVQRVENPLLGRTTVSRGTLAQRRPDRFLMDFTEPAGDRIVSDGEHLWVYYPSVDAGQVMRLPAGAGAGGVDLQAQFLGDPTRRFEPELRGEESVEGRIADVLVLTPRVPTGYSRLVLWVDRRDALARRFEITEESGTVRRFDLSGLRTGLELPDSLFRFTPPPGARIIDRG